MTVFFLCTFISFNPDQSPETKPLKLTSFFKINPHSIYYANNQFNATVTGQLRLNLELDPVQENLLEYNALVVEGFNFTTDTKASLNWKINETSHQVLFNKTSLSINPIDFQTQDASLINDLHLLLDTHVEVGHKSNFQESITFRSIYLDQLASQNSISANLSQWLDFTPLKFSSINAYTSSRDLNLKGLIFRLTIWLIFSTFLFLMIKINSKNLIATIILAWLFSSLFYLKNHLEQHQQLNAAFPTDQLGINRIDQSVLALANAIDSHLITNPSISTHEHKFVVLGLNDFFNLRLVKHLMKYNIAVNSGIQKMLDQETTFQPIYIFIQKNLRYCKQPDKYSWLTSQLEFIHVDELFCMVRKK